MLQRSPAVSVDGPGERPSSEFDFDFAAATIVLTAGLEVADQPKQPSQISQPGRLHCLARRDIELLRLGHSLLDRRRSPEPSGIEEALQHHEGCICGLVTCDTRFEYLLGHSSA